MRKLLTSDEEDKTSWDKGTRVMVFGLNSNPEFNDTLGTVVGFDEVNGRWKVR